MRWPAVAVLLAASCSGSDPVLRSGSDVVRTSPGATLDTSTDVVADDSDVAETDEPESVRIDVRIGGTQAELTGTLAESDDPFGQFVSCSGLRASYGTYSVVASASVGEVRSISVASAVPVQGPGVYDAAVRVEFATARAADATGTITLEDDGRSGAFVSFDSDGASVEGTFDCVGGDAAAEPLTVGSDDGVLEAVEVFALLRSGEAQRIVGLAVRSDGAGAVECPGASGASDGAGPIVRVDGDESFGAITMFEITGGSSPTMRFRVGTTEYDFDRVVRSGADPTTAGSFSAESDGLIVDGAFRCT